MKYKHIVADFEATTTTPVKVWLGCWTDSKEFKPVFSKSIDLFMLQIFRFKCANIYFHNLKYDGGFIFNYLLSKGYEHVQPEEYAGNRKKYFVGDFRMFTIYNGNNVYNVIDTFYLYPTSIRAMGEALSEEHGIKILKGDTPLYETVPEVIPQKDYDYAENDVRILYETIKHNNDFLTYENGITTRATKSNKALLQKLDLKEGTNFKPLHKPKQLKLKPYEDLYGYDEEHQPIIKINKEKEERYYKQIQTFMEKKPFTFAKENYNKTFPFDIPPEVKEKMEYYQQKADERQKKRNLKININSIIKRAYRGGYSRCNPMYQFKEVGEGLVFDINSMYPWIMRDKDMPGDVDYIGLKSKGTIPDKFKGLYILEIDIKATVKDGCTPIFKPRADDETNHEDYYEDTINFKRYYITNMEYDYLLKCYDIEEIVIKKYIQFKINKSIDFESYIDDKMIIKENSKGMTRAMSKLDMNSPYGKFGYFNKRVPKRRYFLDKNGVVQSEVVGHQTIGNPMTDIQIGAFITAYGRVYIGETINQIGLERFAYSDTDSVHILGTDLPPILIHKSKLGHWKLEDKFTRAKYLLPKTYAEEIDGEWRFTMAGYNGDDMTYDKFELGMEIDIKRSEQTSGGTIIKDKKMIIGANYIK